MILSLIFATSYMIFDLNFAESGSREIIKELLNQYFGRLQITHQNYYSKDDTKSFNVYKTISQHDPLFKNIPLLTPRVTLPILISGLRKTQGVLMVGINPERERQLTKLRSSIKEGSYFTSSSAKELIIGKKIAIKIGASIGDEIGLVGQALDGSLANDIFKLVGIIDFGGGDLEDAICFSPLMAAQEFAVIAQDQVHQMVDFNTSSDELYQVSGYRVSPWQKILPEISVSVKFIDYFTWIVSIIIVTVISLGLSNTLMISFLEREKELNSLNVIGASPRWISLSLFLEVIFLGTIGVFFGLILGHFITQYFQVHPINIEMFTGGKPIMLGGMTIIPLVRLYPVAKYYWQSPLVVYFFLILAVIYPIWKINYRRSKNVN